jgi:hypothetical protein
MQIHKDGSWKRCEEAILVRGASRSEARQSAMHDPTNQPGGDAAASPVGARLPQPELAVLFDRYLDVVRQATQRVGGLFPYNQLRAATRAALGNSAAHVVVLDAGGEPIASFAVAYLDGELRRVRDSTSPVCTWAVTADALEHAAAEPWAFVTNPRKLDFAWFRDHDGPSRGHVCHEPDA